MIMCVTVQRLKQEVDHMTRLSQQKDSENAIIAEMLESTLTRLEETGGVTQDTEVNYIRENLGLKKEVKCSSAGIEVGFGDPCSLFFAVSFRVTLLVKCHI